MRQRTSDLSLENVLRDVHDADSQSLRTTSQATVVAPGGIEVNINHEEDSIALGNGQDLLTSTEEGGKIALDVHVSNQDLDIRNLQHPQDSVSLGDGVNLITSSPSPAQEKVPVDTVNLAKPFSKPYTGIRVETKDDDGNPTQIITNYAGTDVQMAVITYDADGDFQSLEVTNL